MRTLLQDLKYGARILARNPGFSLVVTLTLALAIGANTVIFSFANVLVIRPLPIKDPERIGWIFNIDPQRGSDRGSSSYPDYVAWREGSRAFESLAAWTAATYTLTGRGEPLRLTAQRVTANLFPTWGLQPVAGRLFRPDDDAPGAPSVAVLSHRFWIGKLSASPSIVGEALTLNGELHDRRRAHAGD